MSQMILAAALLSLLPLPHADSLDGNLTLLVKDQMNIGDLNIVQVRLSMSGGPTDGADVVVSTHLVSGNQTENISSSGKILRNSSLDFNFFVKALGPGVNTFTVSAKTSNGMSWTKELKFNSTNKTSLGEILAGSFRSLDSKFSPAPNSPQGEYFRLSSQVTVAKSNETFTTSGWIAPTNGKGYHLSWNNVVIAAKAWNSLKLVGTDKDGNKVELKGSFRSYGKVAALQVTFPSGGYQYYYVKN